MSHRIRTAPGLFVLGLIFVLLATTATAAFAQPLTQGADTKQVGLVVAFPDGSVHTEVVTVPAAATSIDALRAAQLTIATSEGAYGTSLCKINATGCPAENCFCDAQHFWAYYHLNGAAWEQAAEGAGAFVPANRAVEGFAWSGFDAQYNPTVKPPVYTFDQLLAAQATPSPTATVTASPTVRPTFTPAPSPTPHPTPAPGPTDVPEPMTLVLLGGGVAALAGYARKLRKKA